jgi:surface protein
VTGNGEFIDSFVPFPIPVVPRLWSSLALLTFPLRIRSKTFLNSDRASFFLLVWCVLRCLVARVGRVTVFLVAGSFDQDIGSWDVSAVTTMTESKCLPYLARSFSSCIDPRRDLRVQGSCATTTADGPSPFTCRFASFHVPRTFDLHLPCSLSLANPFEDLFEL